MDFEWVLANRRSIRKFIKDKDIKRETVHKIIEAARLCQSAKNRQPWLFMILEKEQKDEIAKMMIDYVDNNEITFSNSYKSTASSILEAPVMILVFKKRDDNWNIGDNLSIGAAIEHMCLEATNLGLGSLWIRDTVCVENKIKEYLGKSELELVSSIILGYQDEYPNPRPRKSFTEIVIK